MQNSCIFALLKNAVPRETWSHMFRNVSNNENGNFGENSPKVCKKFKDVRRGPLKSGNFGENGDCAENLPKIKRKFNEIFTGAPWKVAILTKMAKMANVAKIWQIRHCAHFWSYHAVLFNTKKRLFQLIWKLLLHIPHLSRLARRTGFSEEQKLGKKISKRDLRKLSEKG